MRAGVFVGVWWQLSREEQLQQKLLEEQFSLLQATVTEAENIIQDAVAKLDDPLHIRCTSSPGNVTPSTLSTNFYPERVIFGWFPKPDHLSADYLISRAEATLSSVDKVQAGHSEFVKNMKGNFEKLSQHFGCIIVLYAFVFFGGVC